MPAVAGVSTFPAEAGGTGLAAGASALRAASSCIVASGVPGSACSSAVGSFPSLVSPASASPMALITSPGISMAVDCASSAEMGGTVGLPPATACICRAASRVACGTGPVGASLPASSAAKASGVPWGADGSKGSPCATATGGRAETSWAETWMSGMVGSVGAEFKRRHAGRWPARRIRRQVSADAVPPVRAGSGRRVR